MNSSAKNRLCLPTRVEGPGYPKPIQVADCGSHRHTRNVEGTRIQHRDAGGNILGETGASSEACGAGMTRTPVGADRKRVSPG